MYPKELETVKAHGCACGRDHVVTVDKIVCGAGVIAQLPEILAGYGAKKPYLLFDRNTYAAAGERVCALLDAAGIPYASYMYKEDAPEPNEHNVGLAFMFFDIQKRNRHQCS